MNKTKLAIYIEDEEYEERFVKCVMTHYKESYEIHVIDCICDIKEKEKRRFDVIITEDEKEISHNLWADSVVFVLQEDELKEDDTEKQIFYIEKYQEVYRIMEELEKVIAQKVESKICVSGKKGAQIIGVFSMEKEAFQLPFTALLADVLGEKQRVLLMDMQPYSGFWLGIDSEEEVLGMEDVMTVASSENYTSNRLVASIGHEQRWDYIYPVKKASCLAEVSGAIYQKMIHILQKERGYEQIIINFGAMFPGMTEFMEQCHILYLLTESKEERTWREENFMMEMKREEKEEFLKKCLWMEIPIHLGREKSWRQIAQNWLWSELGDKLREINWSESKHGADM